jgi:DNA excision repair protein ERCC-2
VQAAADVVFANPLLSSDILEEAVPGNIRKAEHFVAFLKKIVQYLKTQVVGKDVVSKTPLAFLHDMQAATALERKPLRFTYTRLNSLLRTLEITSLDDFNALQDVANFVTLLATYMDGFAVIMEPLGSVVTGITEPLLQLCCLDSSIAIKPVLDRFQSVVITSGTLSPIDLYPKLLDFRPVQSASLPMSTFRPCLLPLIVTRGSDQIAISTRYELRQDLSVIRNYGQLLIDVAANTPDGVCCFFTSYSYMEYVVGEWDRMRILQQVS